MSTKRMLMAVLFFICLASLVSSQGYMGTVSTGTGILSPLTVGKSSATSSNVGSLSSQTNLTGSWAVDLKGSQIKHIDLQMFQENDLILGQGKLSIDGMSLTVTAAGSVNADRSVVFVSQVDGSEAFRLELSMSGTTLAGKYDSLSSTGVRESGTVTGSMLLAGGQVQTRKLGTGTNPSASTGAFVGNSVQSLGSGSYAISKSVYKSSSGQGTSTYS
ncbi:Uncharacterised protein [uncultured archaeon]|nr:Uncharacterised protein [uncultured archaeon]